MSDAPSNSRDHALVTTTSNAVVAKSAKNTVGNIILVHKRQKGNPILDHIKGIPWEYNSDIVVDYQVGSTAVHLYKIRKFFMCNMINVLLINWFEVGTPEFYQGAHKVAWSVEEVGKYIATYKLYEFKSHQLIQERVEADYQSVLRAALTTVRGVNRTDVMTLKTNFGLCPGVGPTKVRRLREAFNKPFYSTGQKSTMADDTETSADVARDPDPKPSNPRDAQKSEQCHSPRSYVSTGLIRSRVSSPEWDIDHISAQRPDINLELSLDLNPSEDVELGHAEV
ncbi:DNA excision repair protein ERCC-1 [Rhizoctonia solani AG-1 IB]|uniref:DNA excision repair protein ERCC-1 n=1 Tax=Thanatephorus cucumeris (strain AG1-IB / isolate 7/3/14) TaxID=1108050 RepID=M5C0A0_THACB|nr:DNA excision repair protein ERCC-1 [Rhizoctonia solani AG-1 IB]